MPPKLLACRAVPSVPAAAAGWRIVEGSDPAASRAQTRSGARWGRGVTVGKFNPPHRGHLLLVRTAARQVGHLHVLVPGRDDQTLPAVDRARWLADAVDMATVTYHLTPDDLPESYESWARRTLEVLPAPPDAAFTSESYGAAWAAAMGAEHVAVDPSRRRIAASGTALRADLFGRFDLLVPAARAALCRRVVLVGAESTGKTTLASALAADYGTVWVPEHGRAYAQGREHLPVDHGWASWEFRRIAAVQQASADDMARVSRRGLLVCDTDALTTAVWHRRYTGGDDPRLEEIVAAHRPDLYLVCGPDIPWTQDGTRDSRMYREAMHAETLGRVEASGCPHVLLDGSHATRLAAARAAVEEVRVPPPLR